MARIFDRHAFGFVVAWTSLLATSGCGTSGGGSLQGDGDASGGAESSTPPSDASSSGSIDSSSTPGDGGSTPRDGAPSDARPGDGAAVSTDTGALADSADDQDAGAGLCDAAMTAPVSLYSSTTSGNVGIAIDDTWVYVGVYGMGVLRVPKAGGAMQQVPQYDASKSVNFWGDAPSNIAVDADYVYWLVDGTGVARSPKTSSFSQTPPTLIASISSLSPTIYPSLRGLAVNATAVFFDNTSGQVVSFPIGGGAASFLAAGGDGFAYSIAADSSGVFWADDVGGIFRGTPGTESPVLLASGYPWDLTLDSTTVYWTDNLGEVRKIDKQATDAGAAVTLAPMGVAGDGNGIAVDDQFVYWGDYTSPDAGGTSSLRKVPKTGGDIRVLATGVAPSEIVTDATCIYYVDAEQVMRVSKWAGNAP